MKDSFSFALTTIRKTAIILLTLYIFINLISKGIVRILYPQFEKIINIAGNFRLPRSEERERGVF